MLSERASSLVTQYLFFVVLFHGIKPHTTTYFSVDYVSTTNSVTRLLAISLNISATLPRVICGIYNVKA